MMTKERQDRLYPRWLWPALAALACVMAAMAVSEWLQSPVRTEPQGQAPASPTKKASSLSRTLAAVPKQVFAVTSWRAQSQMASSGLKSGL